MVANKRLNINLSDAMMANFIVLSAFLEEGGAAAATRANGGGGGGELGGGTSDGGSVGGAAAPPGTTSLGRHAPPDGQQGLRGEYCRVWMVNPSAPF